MNDDVSAAADAKARYAGLIEAFGVAWEKGSGEGMSDVFTEDGVFVAMPFDAPLRGRAAIAQYWKDIPQEQAEVNFRNGEIFRAGPWFSTEFKCTFRRRRTGELVDIRGALFCETRDDKVCEMRMYWHRSTDRRSGTS